MAAEDLAEYLRELPPLRGVDEVAGSMKKRPADERLREELDALAGESRPVKRFFVATDDIAYLLSRLEQAEKVIAAAKEADILLHKLAELSDTVDGNAEWVRRDLRTSIHEYEEGTDDQT